MPNLLQIIRTKVMGPGKQGQAETKQRLLPEVSGSKRGRLKKEGVTVINLHRG